MLCTPVTDRLGFNGATGEIRNKPFAPRTEKALSNGGGQHGPNNLGLSSLPSVGLWDLWEQSRPGDKTGLQLSVLIKERAEGSGTQSKTRFC